MNTLGVISVLRDSILLNIGILVSFVASLSIRVWVGFEDTAGGDNLMKTKNARSTLPDGSVTGVTIIGHGLDKSFKDYLLTTAGWWENNENLTAYHYLIPSARLNEALKQGACTWPTTKS
ncbi:MAG TPA: hypothetical protein VMW87_06195 [Spirochaetia bacterium]|nr:hypothetical protein [Spirochaetia bacterium]